MSVVHGFLQHKEKSLFLFIKLASFLLCLKNCWQIQVLILMINGTVGHRAGEVF